MKKVLKRFFIGEGYDAYTYFGAHKINNGYVFRVYAPNALEVELIGDFNHWNGRNHKMHKIDERGIYELKTTMINKDYQLYRYHIRTNKNIWIDKSDPYAFYSETRPKTASKTYNLSYKFLDDKWMNNRSKCLNSPLNIYEIHAGSFMTHLDGTYMSYEEMGHHLIKYLKENNFTHVELMPLMESPLDASWGYLCSGYFSITSRYGNPGQLKYMIDLLHQNNIGVIMDFVPVHFIKDDYALGKFDGGHVYESRYINNRESQWGSYLFDYSKPEVMSFMLSAIYFYLVEYHIDGIRFDAISNMIFKDGNKNNGEQQSNINWMKKTNDMISRMFPSVMLIAEDSSDYYGVTKPTFEGGLGFDYKWDLGWMNDTLKFMKEDPMFRGDHLNYLNFSMYYFYNERFLLPFSHDEVVHMKGSIINKISGSYEQKFQQLRTLYTYMFTHPGKKLNFMGNELALFDEWQEYKPVNFDILKFPIHDAFHRYFRDLSYLYINEPVLYKDEYNPSLFHWIDCSNSNSVFIFERFYGDEEILVVLNFSGIQYDHYLINTSKESGFFDEIINSDQDIYNGYGHTNKNNKININNHQIDIRLASFGASVLKYRRS